MTPGGRKLKVASQAKAALSGRARWLALTGFVLVLMAIVLVVAVRPFSSGTLQFGISGFRVGYPYHVGAKVGWGYNLVKNTGKEAATLRGVEVLPDADGERVEVVDVRVEKANDGNLGYGLARWPNEEASNQTTEPLDGFVVRAGDRVQIYVIVVQHKPGRTDWDRIRLTYEHSGWERTVEVENGFTVCAPKRRECDTSVDPDAG